MNTKFNKYNQPEKPNIYLGTPNNKKICALTGIDESTFKMTEKLSNTYELSFDISRTLNYTSPITNETVEKENRAFRLISLFMRLYVDGYGWFIIDPPEEDNDSYTDKYSITAQSAEIEFQQHNLHNFKVNQGTTDSYEMLVDGNVQMVGDVEFAKEQIKFYNASNPQLSFLDICLKVAGVTGWTVGYVDTVPKTYDYFDEGVRKEKQTLLADEIGVFDVDSKDLYSFLTQDAAKFFKCIFEFDFDKMQINAYHPENYGKDTNVNISFRNFQKSNNIKIDDTNIFTRYHVQGSNELGIEYVNFGHNYIENLENYLNERYLSSEVIAKYKLWSQDVESNRNNYIENTRLYNKQYAKISELTNKVPLDDCSTDWSSFGDDKLKEAQENYQAQLKGYESYYVDENGEFDEIALKNSVDADDYYQIKNVILPSIQIEMDNRNLPSGQEFEDYIDSYKTDWKLYGLDELENKLIWYRKQKKVAEDEKCTEPYNPENDKNSHTEDYHTELYNKYIDAVHQLDPNYEGSCMEFYNKVKAEIDGLKELQDSYDKARKEIAKSVAKETWVHASTTDDDGYIMDQDGNYITDEEGNYIALSQSEISFTVDDLEELSHIYVDGDYSNENMFLTSSDDSVTAIDEQLKLLNAAQDDLYITSHPQYQYTTDLDNFLGLYEFKEYSEKLNIGDYLYLSVRDDYVVKLRIISMEYNPLCYDNSLQITFSNMIQSRSSRDDIAYILNQSGGSSKNSSTGSSSSNNYLNNEGVSLTPALIQKLVQSGAFQNQLNNIINNNFGSYLGSNGGSISISELNAKMIKVVDIVGKNAFFEYLQSKFISTDTIVAGSGKFKDLRTLVAQIDNLLAGNISSEMAHIIKLTAENVQIDEAVIRDLIAANITVSMLKASEIDTDKFHVKSNDGSLEIVGNTMQFKDKNDVVRIQIGRDTNNNFTFCLYDETGKGILIDSSGIKESAISDGLIKNDMVANGTLGKEKFNFNIVEADENGNIDAGKVLINGKGIDIEFTSIKEDIKSVKKDISNLEPSFNIAVGNENQNIPCTNNGYTSISMSIEIPFVGYVGLTQTPCTVSVGVLPSGITVGEIVDPTETTTGKIILNVAKNSNLGGDNVLNGTIPLTFTISEKTIVKNFTWTKTKSGDPGQNGQNARLFSLDTSTYVIKKNTDETLTPSTIVFSSYYKDGESDTRNDYLGRFLISESTDGLKYSTKYTSAKDEHIVTYTPSSSSISSVKCILCASGGITNELDSQTVVVLTDADGVNEKIKEITETISGVSSKVDAVNKTITDKVWQSDITNSIDNYDKTTIKIIRDQQAEQKTTIEGITTTVSDVQSKVEKKADGSTVQELSERVSTNEQTAEGFRQEVTKNYVTNGKLKDYPTNGQMKTAISESAKEINLSASKTYATKSESATGSEVRYYVSTSSTSLIGGEWSSGTPIWESGKYIWSKTVTTKADGTTSESNPVCIQGAKGENGIGEKGETGTGIVSITPQYYLSSSKTTQTDGSWIDNTAPSWEAGKYMWTRNKIVYSNPSSTVYTEPYCDTSWEAANEVRAELSVRAEEIEGKVADNEKNITEVIQTNKQIQQSVTDANNNITKLQQDSSSFKQEVEKTYMTKDGLNSLKIGGRNLLRNSNTLEFEDYYFVGGTTSYVVDSDGNYVVDEENNMIIII